MTKRKLAKGLMGYEEHIGSFSGEKGLEFLEKTSKIKPYLNEEEFYRVSKLLAQMSFKTDKRLHEILSKVDLSNLKK